MCHEPYPLKLYSKVNCSQNSAARLEIYPQKTSASVFFRLLEKANQATLWGYLSPEIQIY